MSDGTDNNAINEYNAMKNDNHAMEDNNNAMGEHDCAEVAERNPNYSPPTVRGSRVRTRSRNKLRADASA